MRTEEPSTGAGADSNQVTGVQPPPYHTYHALQTTAGPARRRVHLLYAPSLVALHLNASTPTSAQPSGAMVGSYGFPLLFGSPGKRHPLPAGCTPTTWADRNTRSHVPRQENGLRAWLTCTVLTMLALPPSARLGDSSPLLQATAWQLRQPACLVLQAALGLATLLGDELPRPAVAKVAQWLGQARLEHS